MPVLCYQYILAGHFALFFICVTHNYKHCVIALGTKPNLCPLPFWHIRGNLTSWLLLQTWFVAIYPFFPFAICTLHLKRHPLKSKSCQLTVTIILNVHIVHGKYILHFTYQKQRLFIPLFLPFFSLIYQFIKLITDSSTSKRLPVSVKQTLKASLVFSNLHPKEEIWKLSLLG